ncbi:SDR family NAD(P)-dependent oxidoreductase [Burkholderia thailandensis]|uniref:SDR family NAD(P)-dependent oxidoreductase n=1 Tax=Burkholderia thailandensis TaxID=57975 RepID=UPI00016A87CE|nr:SDR family NAD(P)-dependent oxidoreductase [Burkholderia thailandensis]AIS96686.1 short chain dehydrogenase family protein [Burkholderia thailandensis MSMB59]
MTNKQFPVHSGFGAATTATEVLAGRSLSNTIVIVTGGHSGLGLETTRALANAGARVVVAARDVETARAKTSEIPNVEVEKLNLSDLTSVRDFAQRFLSTGRHIDILIGSAGIMACPETRVGPGWEAQFATNHLGHYALVNLLWPALKGGARVVAVSSAGHHQSGIRWDDVQFMQGYEKWLAYGQSKTANALFAVHLDRLGQQEDVRAFSLHPGKIFTPLQRHLTQGEMITAGWLDANGNPADPTFKTPQQGAATQVWAATSSQLDGVGGLYCEDCEIADVDDGESPSFIGVRAYAIDPVQAERLWALSAQLTGINAFSAL